MRPRKYKRQIHRELRQISLRAWNLAKKENRSALRPAPRCSWWSYIWSVRTLIKVGSDGRVPIGSQRLRIEKSLGTKAFFCLHPTGPHSVLAHASDPKQKTVSSFINRPK